MVLTKRQREILRAQTIKARSQKTDLERARELGIQPSTFHSHNTQIFNKLVDGLEVLVDPENFVTFRGRLKKNRDRIWDLSRELRTLLRRSTE